MKLELKHLAPYLPYDLLLWYPEKLPFSEWLDTKKEAHSLKMGVVSMMSCIKGNSKPILHPLSDLTKEIEVHGQKFVPLDLFYEMYGGGHSSKIIFKEDYYNNIIYTPYQLLNYRTVKKLFQWHFDVFGLIKEGLAIDINTLKEMI